MKVRLFFIIFIYVGNVYTQNLTQTIRGTVIDKESKVALPGASIVLPDIVPLYGCTSDLNGKFKMENVPVGRHSLKISFIGYEEVHLKNLELNSAKELVLTIELTEKIYSSKEVIIKAENLKENTVNEMSVISSRQITVEETNKYAGTWGDVSRMAVNFAGVTAPSDERNDIVVRGNSPMGILWRLNGVEIPNPNHFAQAGSSGGAISMINSNLLDNSDFSSGAFAPEYGNAIAAVFDMKFRNGNNEKREYILQLGASGLEAGAEGPFKKRKQASYLFSYRYSTVALLSYAGIKIIESIPDFQDLSFNLNFPFKKKGYISLFGVGGISKSIYKPVKDSLKWDNDGDRFGDVSGSKTAVVSLTWFNPLGKTSYLKTIISASVIYPEYSEDSTGNDYQSYPKNLKSSLSQNNIVSVLYNNKINVRHLFRSGIIFKNQNFKDKIYLYNYQAEPSKQIIEDNSGYLNLLQAFFQYKYNVSDKIAVTPGFHLMYLINNGKTSFEPRLALKWNINSNHSLGFGLGLHSQILPSQIYYTKVFNGNNYTEPNITLDFTKSLHAVISYDFKFSEYWRLKTELYYQYVFSVPVSENFKELSLINFSTTDNAFSGIELKNNGKGYNYGLEATVEKFFHKGYYLLFTASVYNSIYIDGNNRVRNTRYNGNYAFNALGGKEFVIGKRKINTIGFSLKFVETGGQRYTPIDAKLSAESGRAIYIDSLSYSLKTKDFFKIDLRFKFRLNRKRCSHEFAFELGNVLNYKNIAGIKYNPYIMQIENIYDLPRVPLVFYRLEF